MICLPYPFSKNYINSQIELEKLAEDIETLKKTSSDEDKIRRLTQRLNQYKENLQRIKEEEKARIQAELIKKRKLFITTYINKKFVNDIVLAYITREENEFSRVNLVSLTDLLKNTDASLQTKEKKVKKIPFIFNIGRIGYSKELFELYIELSKKPDYLYETLDLIKDRVPYVIDIRQIENHLFAIVQEHKKRRIPIEFMGDGFINLLRLAFVTAFSKNGVALLEEPETTLHPGFMNIIAEDIITYSKYTQFFITTHSLELLQEFLEAAKNRGKLDRINVIRLFKHEDLVDREVLSGTEALEEITTIKTDLRGY